MTSSEQDKNDASEPRGHQRVPVDYPAQFQGDEGSGRGIVMNLTLAGGEIESPIQFPIGARLSLLLQPPSARPTIGITLAIVRWKQGNRFGIEFVSFEGEAKQQLKDMLNQRDDISAG
jgi:hypothetical protein